MTPMETRGLFRGGLLLLLLSLIRIGMDQGRSGDPPILGDPQELGALLEESRETRADQERRRAPLGPGETLDPNRAGEEELDRLPGVGPSLARALVADRAESGGFKRAEDLLRVRGVGPSILEKISPFLDFSRGVPVGLRANGAESKGTRGRSGPGTGRETGDEAGPGPSPVPRVDLNRAGAEELRSLPGIGPALADRILESRIREGPFRRAEDLLRVSGIGPAKLAGIRDLIRIGG